MKRDPSTAGGSETSRTPPSLTADAGGGYPLWRRLALTLLALLPFFALYIPHFLSAAGEPTGFLQYDMPYYPANGREVFERGNGLLYPNPYDPSPDAPVIYFHWLIWLLGFGIAKLHLDPGLVLLLAGVLSAFPLAWLTWALAAEMLPARRGQAWAYLLAMWGGGAICLGQAVVNLLYGRDPFLLLLRLDAGGGMWFLSWGRHLTYPHEAVYHALVALSWLAALRRQWNLSIGAAVLVALTHPFTGLQQLLIQLVWWSIEVALHRDRFTLRRWLVCCSACAGFAAYYLGYLPSFEQHRAIQEAWTLDWSIQTKSIVVAYGPVGALALASLWLGRARLGSKEAFLAVCATVSFSLAIHDRFMTPVQPAHFTRGYVWLPLFLLALPLIQRLALRARDRFGPVLFSMAMLIVFAAAVSDNAAFLVRDLQAQVRGFFLSAEERTMFSWVEDQGLNGVVLCESSELCYLSATYTSLRPYYGHMYNTPGYGRRLSQGRNWFARGQDGGQGGPWLSSVDLILMPSDAATLPDQDVWKVLTANAELTLWERR